MTVEPSRVSRVRIVGVALFVGTLAGVSVSLPGFLSFGYAKAGWFAGGVTLITVAAQMFLPVSENKDHHGPVAVVLMLGLVVVGGTVVLHLVDKRDSNTTADPVAASTTPVVDIPSSPDSSSSSPAESDNPSPSAYEATTAPKVQEPQQKPQVQVQEQVQEPVYYHGPTQNVQVQMVDASRYRVSWTNPGDPNVKHWFIDYTGGGSGKFIWDTYASSVTCPMDGSGTGAADGCYPWSISNYRFTAVCVSPLYYGDVDLREEVKGCTTALPWG